MYILTHPSLINSARLLSREILMRRGININVSTQPYADVPIIRWGNSGGVPIGTGRGCNLNSSASISVCGNKRRFSDVLTRNEIPTVEYHNGDVPEHFPVVIRTVMNGHGGEGIVICRSREDFMRNYSHQVWAYWYNFEFELGVHILNGQVRRVFKKEWPRDNEPEFPIRNTDKGYTFSLREPERYKKLQGVVNAFYAVVPIKFARLDIGWDSENKVYRIIEANSAPSLSENVNTLHMYTDFLIEELGL